VNIRDRIKELRRVPADQLQPNPKNWRKHPESQANALRGILAEVGIASAVLARETPEGGLMLIDGHLRTETLHNAEIPVLVLDVSEEEADKILATIDPLGAMAEADADKLRELLEEVETASEALADMFTELAEEAGILDGLNDAEITEDEAPEPPVDPITKPGDLWILGNHRLLCGDSTKAEDVERLMAGAKADLCFTSPPYGQQRDYTKEGKEKCKDWDGLMRGVFGNLPMADAGQVLVNLGMIHRDGEWIPYWDGWIEWMREQGWRRFGWYVWDKLSGMPGDWNGRLAPAHEFIWHFNRQHVYPEKFVECKDAGRVVAGRTRGVDGKLRVHTSTKRGDAVHPYKIHDNVFRCGTSKGQQIDHPASFPIALPSIAIQSWPGLAYEPFCGSGTTLIAAEQLGRKCYGMEISPAYCDVIVKRWETLTGRQATRGKEQ
jgi:DNA modification methylase